MNDSNRQPDPYSDDPQCDVDPDFPSGEWRGYYLQTGFGKHRQTLVLTFRGGRMTGSGDDSIGRFTIKGRYDVESKEVTWTKSYLGSHDVYYRGFREIKGIWGTWEIGEAHRGGFHIWPIGEDEGMHAENVEEADRTLVMSTDVSPAFTPAGTPEHPH